MDTDYGNLVFTEHALNVLFERDIPLKWVADAVFLPDRVLHMNDGTTHALRRIPDFGNRVLRVVVAEGTTPPRVVTAFFDRRLRSEIQ